MLPLLAPPAVLRYEIEHPVVNDGGMTMWRALGVNSWPTLAVVSPNGRLIAMVAGEHCYVVLRNSRHGGGCGWAPGFAARGQSSVRACGSAALQLISSCL